jgi:hypothetical protein
MVKAVIFLHFALNFTEILSFFFGNDVKIRASIEAKRGIDNHIYKEENQ